MGPSPWPGEEVIVTNRVESGVVTVFVVASLLCAIHKICNAASGFHHLIHCVRIQASGDIQMIIPLVFFNCSLQKVVELIIIIAMVFVQVSEFLKVFLEIVQAADILTLVASLQVLNESKRATSDLLGKNAICIKKEKQGKEKASFLKGRHCYSSLQYEWGGIDVQPTYLYVPLCLVYWGKSL